MNIKCLLRKDFRSLLPISVLQCNVPVLKELEREFMVYIASSLAEIDVITYSLFMLEL